MNGMIETVSSDEPSEEDFENFQDAVAELEEIGTPEDVSDEQREGFEVFVQAAADADYQDFTEGEDLPGVSDEEEQKAEEFVTYAMTTCEAGMGDAPAESE